MSVVWRLATRPHSTRRGVAQELVQGRRDLPTPQVGPRSEYGDERRDNNNSHRRDSREVMVKVPKVIINRSGSSRRRVICLARRVRQMSSESRIGKMRGLAMKTSRFET